MTKIVVDVDCGILCCGGCVMLDTAREYCDIFHQFIQDGLRCDECINAEFELTGE